MNSNVAIEKIIEKNSCNLHNNDRFPNLKATEFCYSCNTKMCYMCGSKHIDNYCAHSCNYYK